MFSRMGLLFLAAASLSAVSTCAWASTINIDSTAGLNVTVYGTPNWNTTTTAITPHSLWQPNNPGGSGAVWISYAATGYGDIVYQPYNGTSPVMSVFKQFTSSAGLFNLSVWADDTANVYLDGNLLTPGAAFTQSVCSGQPIGCRTEDAGVISQMIGAGNHTLEFQVYQVGTGGDTQSNPFGLLFAGTASAVPEPTTYVMFGGGLLALVAGRVRNRRKS